MTHSPSHHPDALPARFVVQRLLGEGHGATTYLARDQKLDRLVVIKSVHGRNAADPAARTRFEREARAAAAINHPNVVGVYDYGTHQGADYLVLRYVDGETLRQHLTRYGRFGAQSAARLAGQILGGLGAIHAAGLIHRDVKPENVIIGGDGLLRITDFGIAIAATDPRLTTHGQIWGTPAYMAPEQALGRPVTPATDIYAVGIILFELLTGRLPFNGKESTAVALAQVSIAPPSLHDANPLTDAPPALEAVVRRALEKDPANRYQTAAEMAEALNEAAHMPAAPRSIVTAAQPTVAIPAVAVEPPADQQTPIVRRPVRRSRRPLLALTLLGVALLCAGIVWLGSNSALGFWQGDDNAPKSAATNRTPTTTRPNAAQVKATATPSATSSATREAIEPTSTQVVNQAPAIVPSSATRIVETPTPVATVAPTKTPKRKKPTAAPSPTPDQIIQSVGPTVTSDAAPISMTFAASDWQGGFVGNQGWYGRPWIALYGAQSEYPQATLTFTLDAPPAGDATLTIDGLDDEWSGNVAVKITVNGVTVHSGPSPWASWDGAGQGENAAWTTASLAIPAGTLAAGANQIVVANTESAANFGTGPYVLLSSASVTSAP